MLVLTATELRCYHFKGVEDPAALLSQTTPLIAIPLAEDAVVRSGQLDLLPDSARRSRHQDHLFPFAVSPPSDGEGDGGADLVLAVDDGPLMWEWVGRLGVALCRLPPRASVDTSAPPLHTHTGRGHVEGVCSTPCGNRRLPPVLSGSTT